MFSRKNLPDSRVACVHFGLDLASHSSRSIKAAFSLYSHMLKSEKSLSAFHRITFNLPI